MAIAFLAPTRSYLVFVNILALGPLGLGGVRMSAWYFWPILGLGAGLCCSWLTACEGYGPVRRKDEQVKAGGLVLQPADVEVGVGDCTERKGGESQGRRGSADQSKEGETPLSLRTVTIGETLSSFFGE